MKKLCIYHGDCTDGFGAAWAVREALGEDVEFIKGVYGEAPPVEVKGRDVIIVDFSYKLDVLEAMLDFTKSITVIDHHKTAEAELMPLLDEGLIQGVFDTTKSGAMLAWEFYHIDAHKPPKLIEYIQDRDLWKFELHGTREIIAAVMSYPYDFKVWDDLMNISAHVMFGAGLAILRKHDKDVESLIAGGVSRIVIDEFNVPALNAPHMYASDAGHILGEGEPFAAVYWHEPGAMVFSLRSADDAVDVSVIAARFGGGGHKHAAVFKITMGEHDTLNIQSNHEERDND